MKFPTTPDEGHEFYQFMHLHAVEYRFEGGYHLCRNADLTQPGLWYAEDSIGHRLTCEGMWLGQPRDEAAYINWLADTSHEFKDAYELLMANGVLVPGTMRQPRPIPARVT
jgi:hypothetical protein